MPGRRSSEGEIRCLCGRAPLLGRYGRDRNGDLYVHIKVFKGGKIFGEQIFTGGLVRIKCRECERWNSISIRPLEKKVDFRFDHPLPDSMPVG